MSSTQKRRNAYDYREEYFKHNKGLLGTFYFCALCYKPLTRDKVEVDHIIPLAKNGINHVCNCTSTCRKCNRSKSDKIDERVVREIIFKVFEELIILFRKGLTTGFKLSLRPIKSADSVLTKLMIAVLYILLIKAIINL